MGCLQGEEGHSAFQRLLDKVREERLDVQTVVSLLRLYQDSNPAVKTVLSDRKPDDVEAAQQKGRRKPCSPGSLHCILCRSVTFAPVIHFFSGLVIVK